MGTSENTIVFRRQFKRVRSKSDILTLTMLAESMVALNEARGRLMCDPFLRVFEDMNSPC